MIGGGNTPSVLRRLLETAGYLLYDRPEGLVAVRARDRRAVVVLAGLKSPADVEHLFPVDSVRRTLVYAEDPGAVARSLAAEHGMEILDSSTLGPALGELLLPPNDGTLDPSTSDGAPSGLEAPAAVFPEGIRTVRPRFSRDEAESIAGVEDCRITLRLIPYYVGAYRVRRPNPHGGPGTTTSEHLVAVNAISQRVEVWEPGDRELTDTVQTPHQRLAPQLSEPAARALAEESLRRRHTVSVDHTEQHGAALVIETRRVAPAPRDLQVGPLTLLYVPFWYAEGSRGRVVLDAVTGGRAAPEIAPGAY